MRIQDQNATCANGNSPRITAVRIVPVAGYDSMLLNLSGANEPYFARNLAILTDSTGRTGVGEVPGGERIRRVMEEARDLIIGRNLGSYNAILNTRRERFADRDSGGRGTRRAGRRTRYGGRGTGACPLQQRGIGVAGRRDGDAVFDSELAV